MLRRLAKRSFQTVSKRVYLTFDDGLEVFFSVEAGD